MKVEGLDNPDVQEAIVRGQMRTARVARLATTDQDGRPHLVPIVFVLDGQRALLGRRREAEALAQTPARRERP